MKPAFALDLRDDAIGLLHRSGPAWQQVGGVAMDEPDLTGALSYLRATALGLSPRGITTKLVIPNDQILYTTVSAPGPDDESRRSQIRAALDGRTPYAPEDLVFDWSGTGDEVQVAVVARETLDEAESFAARHRFNPISFVAVPEGTAFAGEPWFGPSALSVSLLSGIEKVERDNLPVLDIRRNFEPELAAEDEQQDEPLLAQSDAPLTDGAADDLVLALQDMAQEAVQGDTGGDPEVQPEPEIEPAPMEDPSLPDEVAPPPEEIPAQPEPEAPPPADPVLPPSQKSLPAETLAQAIRPLRPPVVEEAPMALDVPSEEEAPVRPSVIDPSITDDVPPMPGTAVSMAFSSRRAPDAAVPGGRVVRPGASKPAPSKPLAASKAFTAEAAPVQRPAMSAPSAGAVRNGRAAPARNGGASLDSPAAKGKKPLVGDLAAAPMAAATAPARPASAKPAAATGLSGLAGAPPRKTRYMGLILTGILLLFLALVAAWSSIFLASSDDTAQPGAVQTASATADPQTAADAAADLPTAEDEALADQQLPTETPDQPTAAPTAENPVPPLDPAPAAAQSAEAAPTAASPTGEQSQDEIFLATMDAAPQTPDPSALPDPEARGDSLPLSQAAPPPFGTTYQFDADGSIKPTPQGVITPEGITLVAGKPPVLPKPRPAALAAAAVAAPVAAAAPLATPSGAEVPFPSDPALAGARPRTRPAALALPAPAAPDAAAPAASPANPDDGAALVPVNNAPPGARPLARPAALAAAAPAAADASASSLAANIDPESISPLAIAISRRPAARPANRTSLNSAVEAAVAEANRPEARPTQPQPEVKLAAAAEPSPNVRLSTPEAEPEPEPEAASVAPSIPTRASVAKQATLKNAFDLGKTNLIGVYGTPSKRYALIRTSSGSFKKVKLGDRVDGGKVVSIGDDELRVQKGGRTVVLALPKT